MTDRHLRRNGQDYGDAFLNLLPQGQAWPKYPGSTLDLACRGLAEYWGFVDSRAADLLERESDPRLTTDSTLTNPDGTQINDGLLDDWERNWGLPDPCYDAPQTYRERIDALLMRMTMVGGASRQFFTDVAASIGYTITIREYRTFVVGMDRVGDARVYGVIPEPFDPPLPPPEPIMRNEWGQPIMDERGDGYVAEGELSGYPYYGLGPHTNRFYWTVYVSGTNLIWFRCGSGQCGIDPHLRIGLAEDLECLLNRWKPAHTEIIFDYSGGIEAPPEAGGEGTVYIDFVGDGEPVEPVALSGEPAWVPVNAYAHIDFLGGTPQGRAWLRGTGAVAIDTLLGTDPNTGGWEATAYHPESITAKGYNEDNEPFAFIGAARTKILDAGGITMVVQYENIGRHSDVAPLIMMPVEDPADNDAMLVIESSWVDLDVEAWATYKTSSCRDVLNPEIGQTNKVALTITGERGVEIVANGRPGIVHMPLEPADVPEIFVAAMMSFTGPVGEGYAIQSITIYDPLPSYEGMFGLTGRPWVPDARAWVDGAEVPVESVVGTDVNTEEGWGETYYDPKFLTPDGYAPMWEVPGPPALIGYARDKLLAGATIKIVWKDVVYENTVELNLMSLDGNDAVAVDADSSLDAYSWGGDTEGYTDQVIFEGRGSINAYAATIDGMRLEAAANGVANDVIELVLQDLDRPAANPLVCVLLYPSRVALRSIQIIDPLPSIEGLAELSDTGIVREISLTNTTVAEDIIVGSLFSTVSISNLFDWPEWSLVDNPGGLFGITGERAAPENIDPDNYSSVADLYVAKPLTPGSYNISILASDYYGPPLAAQPFTITVTDVATPPAHTQAYLDPALATPNVVISGNSLAASYLSNSTGADGARSATAKKTGKFYYECTTSTYFFSGDIGVVFRNNFDGYEYAISESVYVGFYGGQIWSLNTYTGKTLGPGTYGDTISVAADFTLGKFWFRRNGGNWNGEPTADPATNVGGVTLTGVHLCQPYVGYGTGSASNPLYSVFNFGETPYLYAVPSGFANWPVPDADVPVTFSTTKLTSVTLSGGGLIATNTGTTSTNQGARVGPEFENVLGKGYYEITLTTLTGGSNCCICSGRVFNDYTNGQAVGAMMYIATGNITTGNQSASGKTLGARSAGDVIGVACDYVNRLIWYRVAPSGNWNGDATANPATGVGGLAMDRASPYVRFGGTGGLAGNVFTANFGQSAFTGAVPSGFTSGFLAPPG